MSLLRQSSINGLIAFGMTCVILTDAIDLSVGSVLALSTALCAGMISSGVPAGARMATEYLIEQIGEGAKAAELQGVPGASATIDRGAGFHEAADEALDVVASQSANFDRAEGMTVMENILQSDSSIKGVFAHNDEMALGALQAIAATGKDIKVVGFDATDDAVNAVKAGKMTATVAQKPELMGETAILTAIKMIAGEEVEKSLPVEVELVTK